MPPSFYYACHYIIRVHVHVGELSRDGARADVTCSFQADTLKERYQKIGETKRRTAIEELCANFPC